MKIRYIQGDLLQCTESLIVHGCNSMGVMGAGVALGIKRKFPYAYDSYCKIHRKFGLWLGDVIYCGHTKQKMVANAITQLKYGSDKTVVYVDYDAVRKAFIDINSHCLVEGVRSFAMPKIGAGLANGDWEIISKIIEEECKDVQPVCYYL